MQAISEQFQIDVWLASTWCPPRRFSDHVAGLDLQLAPASALQQQLDAREDGAVLAVLEHTTSGRQLVVASCHL